MATKENPFQPKAFGSWVDSKKITDEGKKIWNIRLFTESGKSLGLKFGDLVAVTNKYGMTQLVQVGEFVETVAANPAKGQMAHEVWTQIDQTK